MPAANGLTLTNIGNGTLVAVTQVATTSGTVALRNHPVYLSGPSGATLSTTVAQGTGTAWTATISLAGGLQYLWAVGLDAGGTGINTNGPAAVWVGSSQYREDDILTLKLRSILRDNVLGLNAAWNQFGTSVGTIGTGDIYAGDRERLGTAATGTVALCVLGGDRNETREDGYIPAGFLAYASRVLMLYVRHDDEEVRERLCQTMEGAVRTILNGSSYNEITTEDGLTWFNTWVGRSEYGESYKNGQFVSACRMNWAGTRLGASW
jgi:hypothetical protein